ncbi:MAG: diphthine--ammonia ligase [Chitinophagaceae bacterium]|nr:diphthine--ammonia ligase [Chitinophagaceae bacterium]
MIRMNKIPIVVSWSGGKDSSYALYKILQNELYEVKYLLSTINGNLKRLSMHGVREELIEAQAASIGIPLLKVYVYEADNNEYERQMNDTLLKVKAEGISTVAFGDIFLEDLKQYREDKMRGIGMNCLFPIWQEDTLQLINDFIEKGFKTITCCINDGYLDKDWCGRVIDDSFLSQLPKNVDPCGENGEFHSFCYEAPFFKTKMNIVAGEKTYKELILKTKDHPTPIKEVGTKGFWFCDILLQS